MWKGVLVSVDISLNHLLFQNYFRMYNKEKSDLIGCYTCLYYPILKMSSLKKNR